MSTTACIVHYVFVCGGPAKEKACKQYEPSPDGCLSCTTKNECRNGEAIAEALIKLETEIREGRQL